MLIFMCILCFMSVSALLVQYIYYCIDIGWWPATGMFLAVGLLCIVLLLSLFGLFCILKAK